MGFTALAFDFGTKSIGCAVGQSITGTAQALPAFKAQDGIPNWEQIEKCLREWKPQVVVVGLPLNMDGSEQDLTLRAKKFAQRLHGRFGVNVELQDERLTTTEARAEIFQRGGFKALNKGKIDGISACLILESWFENSAEIKQPQI
ncbi:Holliday junction resolvase RuvX [[Pasteurella] aerogenes]|nr:Holliday junction resolvase RuvX [[Pasteurella] aerogenes]